MAEPRLAERMETTDALTGEHTLVVEAITSFSSTRADRGDTKPAGRSGGHQHHSCPALSVVRRPPRPHDRRDHDVSLASRRRVAVTAS